MDPARLGAWKMSFPMFPPKNWVMFEVSVDPEGNHQLTGIETIKELGFKPSTINGNHGKSSFVEIYIYN